MKAKLKNHRSDAPAAEDLGAALDRYGLRAWALRVGWPACLRSPEMRMALRDAGYRGGSGAARSAVLAWMRANGKSD